MPKPKCVFLLFNLQVRNDATGKAEGNQAHTEATRELLRKLYRPMINSVVENPAVLIV
jgi:hypothetical protein